MGPTDDHDHEDGQPLALTEEQLGQVRGGISMASAGAKVNPTFKSKAELEGQVPEGVFEDA